MTQALVRAFETPTFKKLLHQKGGWDYDKAKDWPNDPAEYGVGLVEREPEDKEEYEFWESIAKNSFKVPTDGSKNPIASRWQRALECPKRRAKYEATSGRIAKATFRSEWAKERHEQVKVTYVQTTEESRQLWKESKSLPIGKIAMELGGGKAGWMLATIPN